MSLTAMMKRTEMSSVDNIFNDGSDTIKMISHTLATVPVKFTAASTVPPMLSWNSWFDNKSFNSQKTCHSVWWQAVKISETHL